MSTGTRILIAAVLGFALIGFAFVAYVIGVKNTCVAFQEGIEAQYKANQVNLAGYTNKIMELVQVPAMAKNHIKEIAKEAIQGRYGEKGSQAIFQAIQEQNPTADPQLYRQIMQEMSAGRNSFDADQKTLLDKCRVAETYVKQAPQSWFASLSYDKTKCDPVINDKTAEDFRTKRSAPLQLQVQ